MAFLFFKISTFGWCKKNIHYYGKFSSYLYIYYILLILLFFFSHFHHFQRFPYIYISECRRRNIRHNVVIFTAIRWSDVEYIIFYKDAGSRCSDGAPLRIGQQAHVRTAVRTASARGRNSQGKHVQADIDCARMWVTFLIVIAVYCYFALLKYIIFRCFARMEFNKKVSVLYKIQDFLLLHFHNYALRKKFYLFL